ncbi:MAG: beta-ketoacyl synthase N-terminal-like domain-containing protein, partial [Proteobacteria bacterium]|nr:beta-ketoacyl synthase N-terminal-like domain-containing protein [Pseudomonadota bacterium]
MANAAIRFGRANHLIGVIHDPIGTPQPFGILLWNTGISHRIGPYRIHFEIAQMLQKKGFPILRFDLSKLGDSDTAEFDLGLQEIFTRDIGDAIKVLEERYALKKFILIGLCSGAVDAWYYTVEDPRVIGLGMIDGFVYPTFRHLWQSRLQRLCDRHRWWRFVQKLSLFFTAKTAELPANDFLDSNYPSQSHAEKSTQMLINRGLELFVLYTGGFRIWYSYLNQFRSMLKSVDFKNQLCLYSWPKIDHLFSLIEDRQQLLSRLDEWFEQKFIGHPIAQTHEDTSTSALFSVEEPSIGLSNSAQLELESHAANHILPKVLETFRKTLHPVELEAEDSFFDFGGNSVLAIKCVQSLNEILQREVPIALLYTHSSAATLALALAKDQSVSRPETSPEEFTPSKGSSSHQAIAIIGMACKVPGAKNLSEFWQLIEAGREAFSHFRPEELDPSLPKSLVQHPNYVASRGVIDAENFDYEFFAMNRREALLLDPQQRILMETCWQALEDAGWAQRRQETRIGVYVGVGSNSYFSRNIMQGHARPHSEEEYLAIMGNDKDYVATRIAYHLDLRGPAVSVHTACSSSLVAVIEAIKTLLTDQADIVIAGAAAINAPIASGHLYQEGSIFSKDGRCRPFAADASGTVFSDGSAVVALKRLDQALADGDRIHGVIHGWGLNNDGKDKSSFAAPSVKGQAAAIRQAYQRAAWSPRSVGFVECHGTATPIGDPIEIEGLRQAFHTFTHDRNFCALGSVKANIGHLTAAAGTIGLIKATLAVSKAMIPPALHTEHLNPELRLGQSPFFVSTQLKQWNESPRRAGISCFGVGGTNAHVLIQEPPLAEKASQVSRAADQWITLTWSAKDPKSALRYGQELAQFIEREQPNLNDLSYTLRHQRVRFAYQCSVSGLDHKALSERAAQVSTTTQLPSQTSRPIILTFPGQGSQYPKMGLDLAKTWPKFANHYHKIIEIFQTDWQLNLRLALDGSMQDGIPLLQQTQYTQPAIFALEWALAQSLIESGLPFAAVLGHSIGEIAAACIAGVMSLHDAARLVFHRARSMQSAPPGAMLAVRCSPSKLQSLLIPGIEICAINSLESCVLGGDLKLMESMQKILSAESLPCKRVETSHAFHTSMMDSVLEEFRQSIQNIHLEPPGWPVISCVDGKILSPERVSSVEYWVQQIRQPVKFLDAVQEASRLHDAMFLELGPRDALTRFVKQILADDQRWPARASLPKSADNGAEEASFARTLDQLAMNGFDLYIPKHGKNISAPAYSFLGEKLWLHPVENFQLDELSIAALTSKNIPETPQREAPNSSIAPCLALLRQDLAKLVGLNIEQILNDQTWSELGLDSLLLTQWALKIQKEWRIDMNINMLQNHLTSLKTLAEHLQKLQPQSNAHELVQQPPRKVQTAEENSERSSPLDALALQDFFNQQFNIMQKQLEILQNLTSHPASFQVKPPTTPIPTAADRTPAATERPFQKQDLRTLEPASQP